LRYLNDRSRRPAALYLQPHLFQAACDRHVQMGMGSSVMAALSHTCFDPCSS
jgi:hypothetical protein